MLAGGVLAFDLAFRYGWAYVGPDGAYVDSGARALPEHLGQGGRSHALSMAIADLIDEFGPACVAIEKPIHAGRFTSFETAYALYGYATVAALVAHIRECPFIEIPRSTCCKAVLGRGNAVKADGVLFARRFEPLCNSDDQADAILVAMAAHKLREKAA